MTDHISLYNTYISHNILCNICNEYSCLYGCMGIHIVFHWYFSCPPVFTGRCFYISVGKLYQMTNLIGVNACHLTNSCPFAKQPHVRKKKWTDSGQHIYNHVALSGLSSMLAIRSCPPVSTLHSVPSSASWHVAVWDTKPTAPQQCGTESENAQRWAN